MDTYVVTGATKGIGFYAARYLRNLGHETINIDIDGGDIHVDLGTREGRERALSEVFDRREDGIDGLILNAGIVYQDPPSRVLSVNYFGTVALAEGLFPLLRKKSGRCAITTSGVLAFLDYQRGRYYVDELLLSCGDEARIGQLVDSFPSEGQEQNLYASTKIALVKYIRRVAPAWAVSGVNLNGLAPGGTGTAIMDDVPKSYTDKFAKFLDDGDIRAMRYPMPTIYGKQKMMDAQNTGEALATLVLPEMKGLCGDILYCDGGTSTLIHSEKWY